MVKTKKCSKILEHYEVNFCYLFGSYAKGKATPSSDVDLLISTSIKGLKFYGLVEEIRTTLHKRVDVLDINQLKDNIELTEEIFKYGIKIQITGSDGDLKKYLIRSMNLYMKLGLPKKLTK